MGLDAILKKYGRKRVSVLGNGNCQFYAFFKSLKPKITMDNSFHSECDKQRRKVGFYLWKNRKRFGEFFDTKKGDQGCYTFRSFCQEIASNNRNVIGNNLTIKALAEMNNVNAIIFQYNGEILRIDASNNGIDRIAFSTKRATEWSNRKKKHDPNGKKIIEICYTGGHYDSVTRD